MEAIIAISPSHRINPNIAIAACRAGELGILDLGLRNDEEKIKNTLSTLQKFAGTRGQWGIRWDTMDSGSRSTARLKKYIKEPVSTLILAGVSMQNCEAALHEARQFSERVFIEVLSLKAALTAQSAGYNGVIVKGNEAGGYVSSESSFILLQRLHNRLEIPYWIQGGMGLHTITAARTAGASGVVLCEQLWLTEESPFSDSERNIWQQCDGSETICINSGGTHYRCYSRFGPGKVQELESSLAGRREKHKSLNKWILNSDDGAVIACGQDIGLASSLANKFGTVGCLLSSMRASVSDRLSSARKSQLFATGSAMAKSHGTRYPIVQGPMARVSDIVPFGEAVAVAGGLPFFGLALMREPEIRKLLAEARDRMNSMPWGVGVLGFVPRPLLEEQLAVIKEFVPPFAVIAGGRPSQAAEFESFGTSAYLHVPSIRLLNTFLKEGARKFIFEGRECGGHVGPLSSFALWESAIDNLLKSDIRDPKSLHVLFAGGIHDGLSAAMVEALAAPLSTVGIKAGVLMGTAYLFTDEAVKHGAITPEYQKQAMECETTALLQSGAGHASRCIKTPFADQFYTKKQELSLSGKTDHEIIKTLESMNLGRLRIAAKGIARRSGTPPPDDHDQWEVLDEEAQRYQGLFMVGQVAELRNTTLSIADLHADVSEKRIEFLEKASVSREGESVEVGSGEDIAIVGMSCIFPEASDLKKYWNNILNRVCATREVPHDRWNLEEHFEADRFALEKSYSKWGCFIDDIQFDPAKYGIAPRSLASISGTQLFALEVAWQALQDAGYHNRTFPRERTSVIFATPGSGALGIDYAFRGMIQQYISEVDALTDETRQHIVRSIRRDLPQWTEDSFTGTLPSIVAGRVANRLDLGGTNFSVEAACASSLASVEFSVRQLRDHACDVALAGAADFSTNPVTYLMFSRSQALSPTGQSRPLDDSADGIVMGEGVSVLVLKRLSDAERDGDHIYALIKGVGSSSDGRNRSLVAPHPEGQVRSLRRAYRDAGVNINTVELIEFHGTGTVAGDKAELESLAEVFGKTGEKLPYCAIGSVKSMIGHTKIAAGLAGIIKSALALKHRILPPTIGVEVPNSNIDYDRVPFYINTEALPWFTGKNNGPRRAGVSSFGFGGTNFHVVLEEYDADYREKSKLNLAPREAEIFSFSGTNRSDIEKRIAALLQALDKTKNLELPQLAYSVFLEEQIHSHNPDKIDCRLNIVASSIEDLEHKLKLALSDSPTRGFTKNPVGLYYSQGEFIDGAVCFLFPGQGSQKINMFKDLVIAMPEMYPLFEMADRKLDGCYKKPLSRYIYPIPVFSDKERLQHQEELNDSHVAQPVMGLINLVAFDILKTYNIKPDILAGHSFGEYVALCIAESISKEDFIRLSEIRGSIVQETLKNNTGTMAAVQANLEVAMAVFREFKLNTSVANCNAPDQIVIGGTIKDIEDAVKAFRKKRLPAKRIPVKAAFHTPAMRGASEIFSDELGKFDFQKPKIKVFSNTTAQLYPQSPKDIRNLLIRHMCEPVKFDEEIREIYANGARVFIEAGPGRVLSPLVERILNGKPYHSLSMDVPGRSGWVQLAHLLAHAKTIGIPVDLKPWFERRRLDNLSIDEIVAKAQAIDNPGPLIWRISGERAFPFHKPQSKAKPHEPQQPESRETHIEPMKQQIRKLEKTDLTLEEKKVKTIMTPPTHTSCADTGEQMNIDDTSNAASILNQFQNTMSQFLELQNEHQKTMQKFIDMQVKMFRSSLNGEAVTAQSDKPGPSVLHSGGGEALTRPDTDKPVFVSGGVPPTPTLPMLPTQPSASESTGESFP
ncbi:beta-ketoacyl synthase N-terminal-like domain-containing protein, partial [Thermodesulfobacteriota bacterium]